MSILLTAISHDCAPAKFCIFFLEVKAFFFFFFTQHSLQMLANTAGHQAASSQDRRAAENHSGSDTCLQI